MENAEKLMGLAIGLAEGGRGLASPNPMVGAVVVDGGDIVGFGYHERYGGDHAETIALGRARNRTRGATLYVSLEPCCHTGHTPPCTKAILESGVAKVVVGALDPNPAANGKGIQILRDAGVSVEVGVMSDRVRKLNRSYFKSRETGKPWVRLKLAMTLDGKVADGSGESRWISCETSRAIVHKWRGEADAIVVGIGTALSDNPSLLPRDGSKKRPARLILDSTLRLPLSSKLVAEAEMSRVIVATASSGSCEEATDLEKHGVSVWSIPDDEGRVDLEALFERLTSEGIIEVMCEGGPVLAGALIEKDLVDLISLFVAPKLLGPSGVGAFEGLKHRSINSVMKVPGVRAHSSGEDLLLEIPVSDYN